MINMFAKTFLIRWYNGYNYHGLGFSRIALAKC